MNPIEEAKQKLKEKGYTSFNVKDLNENFYNFLLKYKCNSDVNLQKKMNCLRFDGIKTQINKNYDSFASANEFGSTFMADEVGNSVDIFQYWYYTEALQLMNTDYDNFLNYVFEMVAYLYDTDDEFVRHSSQFTYYTKDCFLKEHSDGYGTGRICAVLIYLNETYDENDGGYLILDKKDKVLPIFGNVAIIDLESSDIKHEVKKVTGGIGRYAILSFVKRKQNQFVNY